MGACLFAWIVWNWFFPSRLLYSVPDSVIGQSIKEVSDRYGEPVNVDQSIDELSQRVGDLLNRPAIPGKWDYVFLRRMHSGPMGITVFFLVVDVDERSRVRQAEIITSENAI